MTFAIVPLKDWLGRDDEYVDKDRVVNQLEEYRHLLEQASKDFL
jgi:hypothetical protein